MKRYKVAYWISLIIWALIIIFFLVVPVKSTDKEVEPPTAKDMELDAILAVSDVHAEAKEPVTYEDWFRANANVIEDCEITWYCCEDREHICGTGDGITSTGVPVTAGWTCAVDPSVIPYGCEVMVDFGDHVEFYKAQDCGGAIKGNHIDLATATHREAIESGRTTATVYFMEVEREFN